MTEHLPDPDPARVADTTPEDDDLLTLGAGTRIVRAFPAAGPHPVAWNTFRSYGPTSSRFDHHPDPQGEHPDHRIAYAARAPAPTAADPVDAFTTALAEMFQGAGTVLPIARVRDEPRVAIIELIRAVRLLRLDSGWVTRAGGNMAICSGPRPPCRLWAQAIHAAHDDIEGLAYRSAVYGPGRCVALWERAEDAFGVAPQADRALADRVLDGPVAVAARALGVVVL